MISSSLSMRPACSRAPTLNAEGGYSITGIVPGSYNVGVYDVNCAFAGDLLGSKTFNLLGNVTADGDIDITATAGRVTGLRHRYNTGSAVFDPQISSPQLLQRRGLGLRNNDGSLRALPRAGQLHDERGDRAGRIAGNDQLHHRRRPDHRARSRQHADRQQRLGRLRAKGSGSGSATCRSSTRRSPPPAPPASRPTIQARCRRLAIVVIGPAWYEVTTTATYSGEVTVCVHYTNGNRERVGEPGSTPILADATNSFTALTNQSIDSSTGVICGETTAVSTFAIIEQVFPSIAPATVVSLPPRGTQQFVASGGSGTGYVWSVGRLRNDQRERPLHRRPDRPRQRSHHRHRFDPGHRHRERHGHGRRLDLADHRDARSLASSSSSARAAAATPASPGRRTPAASAPPASTWRPRRDRLATPSPSFDLVGNTASAIITLPRRSRSTPGASPLAPGATHQFNATGGSGTVVSWSTTGGSVSSTGFYTAPPTGPTSATVTATDLVRQHRERDHRRRPEPLARSHPGVSVPPLGTH